jgi:hypothetical protein
MTEQQAIIVPQISTLPEHEARARLLVRWLSQQNIIEPQLSTCGRAGLRMAYAIAPGARKVVKHPERLPYAQAVNGLEIINKRCIYTPTRDFAEEAGCPQCRQEVGEALFESLDEWMPGATDNFQCPLCGHEDDINGFLFLQGCGFSNLGLVFNNWADAEFTDDFLAQTADRLGFKVRLVRVDL